ncbi:MAG: hypothetical protein K1Y36_04895 [Blastocatellia bacterium]|nr:hypothetical protein [Blastocatellia bacterium]
MLSGFLCLALVGFSLVTTGCAGSGRLPQESDRHPELFYLEQQKQIQIEKIVLVPNPKHTIFGRMLDMYLKNTSGKPLVVTVEPGTVLRSMDRLYTSVVVMAGEVVPLAPNESRAVTVEVFSIEFNLFSPSAKTQYRLGNKIGGDTASFISCFAKRRPDYKDPTELPPGVVQVPTQPGEPATYILPPTNVENKGPEDNKKYDLMPVQLAIWRLTEGIDRDKILKSVADNPKLKGGEFSQNVKLNNNLGPYVQQLLNDCGLEKYKF